MKNIWPVSVGLSAVLAVAIGLAGCGSLPSSYTNGPPATVAYMFDHGDITGYSIVAPNIGSPVGTLTVTAPSSTWVGSFTTDSTGQIYIGTYAIDGAQNQILVYPPNSTGATAPSRTIDIGFAPVEIAVDHAGRMYVVMQSANTASQIVAVYSATANGGAAPLRSLQPTDGSGIQDLAADGAGNIYVATGVRDDNGNWNGGAVKVYPSTANGPSMSARTITFPLDSYIWGIAVAPEGDIFAEVKLGAGPSYTGFVIEEFAPEANGTASPVNTINLPIGSEWDTGGPLRLDGAGNIFTSLEHYTADGPLPTGILYGFAPTASGATAPTVQVLRPGSTPYFGLN